MIDLFYYRHWYLVVDEAGYEIQRCSDWVDHDWIEYAQSNYRNECDGYGNLLLLETDKRGFKRTSDYYRDSGF